MRGTLAWILGIGLAVNGLVMLAAPEAWYGLVPGVADTGLFNPHFVRDIGAAYLVAGTTLPWLAMSAAARPAALAGAAFLVLHALIHVWDAAAGRAHVHALLRDIPTVIVPAALAVWIAWPAGGPHILTERRPPMIGWFLRRWLTAFERQWNYDAGYMHDVLAIDPRALMLFSKAIGLGRYRHDVPAAPHYAVALVGLMAEDCGPCTQLTIDMAQREGVDPAVLRAIVSRDFEAMPEDVVLAVRFAEAVLRRDAGADDLREEIVRRWGKRALVSLAFGLTAARLYPPLKYALGHGQACRRLEIGGTSWQAPQAVGQAA